MHKRLLLPILLVALISTITFAGIAEDKVVIHHTGAFSGEVQLLNQLMTDEYGPPSVLHGKMGRTYYIWETGQHNEGKHAQRCIKPCLDFPDLT